MMNKFFLLTFLIFGLFTISPISAQKNINVCFTKSASLPVNKVLGSQPGLAGVFTGNTNNKIIIAGGANFPGGLPWEGGKKTYWNQIYVFSIGKKGEPVWETTSSVLKENLAYGASVQTDNGVLCIGGDNENGISKKVFLMRITNNDNEMEFVDYPELPIPLTNLSATKVNNIVYAAGGETVNAVSDKLFALDLKNLKNGWVELAALPKQVSHAVMLGNGAGKEAKLYLLAGRKRNSTGISDIYASVFEYNIANNQWVQKKDMPYPVAAGVGMNVDGKGLFYIGGDKGETFHKVETLLAAIAIEKDETKKQQLIQQKNALQQNHPGFNKEILHYNIQKDAWSHAGFACDEMPVTTAIASAKKYYYITSGEIKAGVRTDKILIINNITGL